MVHRNRHIPLAVAVVLGAGLFVPPAAQAAASPAAAPARPAAQQPALPSVYPVPQSMQSHGTGVRLGGSVALVAPADVDASALAAARAVLQQAGVARIDQVTSSAGIGHDETAVYLGGQSDAPVTAAVQALGVTDAAALPAEGYVLATGKVDGHAAVVLDGHDATGEYYAVQTLRQLVVKKDGSASVAGVQVRDWPSMSLRGTIEGFYGAPWSQAARLSQLDFYGANKMNTYVYSPKDDPYLRAQWRDPYPAAQLAQLQQLVQRATADHVDFTYALSPGLSVCYSSAADEQALVAKFQTLWNIGVRSFSVPLDDISYTSWNCAADQTKFGTGGGAAGAAQSYLLNEVQKDFIDTHPGAARLQMVPTEYSDTSATDYKNAVKADLDPAVVVGWTGDGVIAPTITDAQAQAAQSVYGHDILLWDNYPVNDYVTGQLLLGPYVGRDPGLPGYLYGLTANPMIEPEASKLALFTVADYAWNSTAYNPQASWQASLTALAGGNPAARTALAAFADLNYTSEIDPVQAPVLAAKLAAFWPAWEQGDDHAAATLDSYLQTIQNIPATLAATMGDPAFITDAGPWLDSAGDWGQAARAALRMLTDERAGNGAAATADRARTEALVTQAQSYTYTGENGTSDVQVGTGVIDTFVQSALAEGDRWFGVSGTHTTATTSLPTYENDTPANMVDGNPNTYFWSSTAPSPGDYVGVDLGSIRPVSGVTFNMSKPTSPDDYIHTGVLEYSSDGTNWTSAGSFSNQTTVSATFPAGTQARYIRFRSTAAQTNWVVVTEITVTAPAGTQPVVSGAPAAAAGTSLAAAADGDLDTAYTAANAPQAGDALVVTLPATRPLDRVDIVGTGSATVPVEAKGAWQAIGSLSAKGWTELAAHNLSADAIRLLWTPGSAAPSISEIVPWYADAPAAVLQAPAAPAAVTVGTATTVPLTLTADRAEDLRARLTAQAPAGLTATLAPTSVDLRRGSQPTYQLTLKATVPGTYQVPVALASNGLTSATGTVTVVAHPPVGTTDVAAAAQGAVATASSVEDGLPQFTPDHAIDGDLTTRWSSGYTDGEWLQVRLASPQNLGKVVLVWEAAHATAYKIETSADGVNWTDAAEVTNSQGGTETVWINQHGVTYLRMQGVQRATQYGYSIYELEAYPLV